MTVITSKSAKAFTNQVKLISDVTKDITRTRQHYKTVMEDKDYPDRKNLLPIIMDKLRGQKIALRMLQRGLTLLSGQAVKNRERLYTLAIYPHSRPITSLVIVYTAVKNYLAAKKKK